jgi:hypothetical protein
MNDTPSDCPDLRRQRFLEQAAAAYDLLFASELADSLVTFDQREQRALELGQQLIVTLLQEHANADAAANPSPQQPPACPRCQRPGRRLTEPDVPLPARVLTTCAGEVTLRRARYRCTTCRVVFFPPR